MHSMKYKEPMDVSGDWEGGGELGATKYVSGSFY